MCGRYSFDTEIDAIIAAYRLEKQILEQNKHGEIFPTDAAPILLADGRLVAVRWGFPVSFSKRPVINARGETVAEKPLFREAFAKRRCVVPATSYYEWKTGSDGKKIKYSFRSSDRFLSMAGIWQIFRDEANRPFPRFVILTTDANESVRDVHHRMPVLLSLQDVRLYLNHTRMRDTDWASLLQCRLRLEKQRTE